MTEFYLLAVHISRRRQSQAMPAGVVARLAAHLKEENAIEDYGVKAGVTDISNIYQAEFIRNDTLMVVGSSWSGKRSLEINLQTCTKKIIEHDVRGKLYLEDIRTLVRFPKVSFVVYFCQGGKMYLKEDTKPPILLKSKFKQMCCMCRLGFIRQVPRRRPECQV